MAHCSNQDEKYVSIRTFYQEMSTAAGEKFNKFRIPDSKFKIPFAYRDKDHELPDFSGMETLIQEFVETAIHELGLEISDADMPHYKHAIRTSIYNSGFYSGASIMSDRVKALAYAITALYLYDDIVDELTPDSTGIPSTLSFEDITVFNKLIMSILSGESIQSKCLQSINFPRKVNILKFIEKSYNLSVSSIPNYKKNCGPYLAAMDEHLQAVAWGLLEFSREVQPTDIPTLDTYIFRRERASGLYMVFEYCQLVRGIHLTEESRNSLVLKQIIRLGIIVMSLVNDLFSWEREMNEINIHNFIHVKLHKEGMTVAQATAAIVERISTDTNELIRLCKLAEEHVISDQNVKDYLRFFQNYVDGNLYLHLYCPRYSYGFEFTVTK